MNGAAINFAASATDPDGDSLTYAWDFGDGASGAGQTTSHVYAAPNSYSVTVTVNDGRGGLAMSSASAAIAQANRPPHASAGGPYAGTARIRVLFDGSVSSDPDNNTLTYDWDFGDGTTGAGASPNHGYAAAGAYTVKLTVDDGRGGKDLATASVSIAPAVVIANQPPLARPGGPYSGQAGVVLTLNGSSSTDADNDALTFSWDFGDSTSGTGVAPVHIYATEGTFTVTMTVDDAHGHTTAAVTSATIAPASDRAPPNVTLSAPSKVLPGTDITVTAAATDNVGIASITFEVDGTPTTLTAPPFQRIVSVPAVAAPGAQIVVRVSASDSAGNVGTAQVTLTIDALPDTEKPTITLNGPGDATPGSTIHLTATADDNVGVAAVAFNSGSGPIATVPVAPYESVFTVPITALPGSTLTFSARATDFTGNYAETTIATVIAANRDTTAPIVSVAAPQSIAPGGALSITADASDDGGVASVCRYTSRVFRLRAPRSRHTGRRSTCH